MEKNVKIFENKEEILRVGRKAGVVFGILATLIFLWVFLPPIGTLKFVSSWVLLMLVSIIVAGIFISKKGRIRKLSAIPVGILILFLGYIIINLPIITDDERYNLIGEIEEVQFSEDLEVVDTSKLRILDSTDALRHAENRLGSESAIGSQFELRREDFTLQTIGEELFWVAPLQHRGFFKWFNNRDGAEGYIKVNANTRETTWVKDHKIKYLTSAYFFDDIHRHIYKNYSVGEGYTDFSFEVDDSGKPYYVVTVYENTIGFAGMVEKGILTVDASSGHIESYDGESYPDWVDRAVPHYAFAERVDSWGRYPNGWFNPSNQGQLKRSAESNIVYDDGRAYYYTGITSWGSDESTTGFILMDTRTGKAKYYKVSGATETKAMNIAEGRVQNAGYTATAPVLINVGGEPTYFMTLKDENNNIAEYAFVSVKDYTKSGVSRNIETAQAEYMVEIGLQTDTEFIIDESELTDITGTIERINTVIREGETFFYIKLEGGDKVYRGALRDKVDMILASPGDKVSFGYLESEDNEIKTFKNDSLKSETTEENTGADQAKEGDE